GEPARIFIISRAPVAGSVPRAAPTPPVKRFLANATGLVIAERIVSWSDSWLDRLAEGVRAVQMATTTTAMTTKIPITGSARFMAVPDQRPRASKVWNATQAQSRGSVQPVLSRVS